MLMPPYPENTESIVDDGQLPVCFNISSSVGCKDNKDKPKSKHRSKELTKNTKLTIILTIK